MKGRGRRVRITGTGHASMRIDTGAGSILCDPWVNPAYFASWFPFPDNSGLDWDTLGQVDYLYVSHLHRDHFDAEHLRRYVSKQATVLLPEYPTSRARGRAARPRLHQVRRDGHQRGGRARRRAQDHDPGAHRRRPTARSATRRCGWSTTECGCSTRTTPAPPTCRCSPSWATCTRTCCSSPGPSGTRWCTSCPSRPRRRSASRSGTGSSTGPGGTSTTSRPAGCSRSPARRASSTRSCGASTTSTADEGNIFPDQSVFMSEYRAIGRDNGVVLLPGSQATVDEESCAVTHPVDDVDEFFANKEQYLHRVPGPAAPGHRGGEGLLAAPRDRRSQGDEAAHRAAARGVHLPGQGRRRPGPVRPRRL